MSTTTLATMQHPGAMPDDDSLNSSVNSSECSSTPEYRARGDFIERAIGIGDTATMLIGLGIVGAALIVFLACTWTPDLMRLAPWAVPIPWALGAVAAWFGFKALRNAWREARAEMRATLAAGLEWRSPQEELDRAVSIGDAALVHRVLSTPVADVNLVRGSYEPTLLHRAVSPLIEYKTEPDDRKNALDTVRALLEHGASYAARDWNRRTALERVRSACEGKDGKDHVPAELVVLLQGATDEQKRAATIRATEAERQRKTVAARRRLEQRTEVFALAASAHDDDGWWSILNDGGGHDDDSMEALLNSFDSTGRTALHWAVRAGNLDFVRWLARHGAEAHQRWNGHPEHCDDDGDPVDADGYPIDFDTPFEAVGDDEEKLNALTDTFAAGLREREADALRVAFDDLNKNLPTHARKRL